MSVGYILNTYPRPSQSFIRREIRALEGQGVAVSRIAMRREAGALIDPADQREALKTEYVLEEDGLSLLCAAAKQAAQAPSNFLRAARSAFALGWRGRAGPAGTGGLARHLIYLLEAAMVAQLARASGLTHLHAHFGTNSATVAMLAAQMTGLPFSFTIHGPEEFDAPQALGLEMKLAACRFAVAISSYGRSQLMRRMAHGDWGKLQVVHCGIDPAVFAAPAPLPEGPLRLVSIGRLSEQKGQLLLLAAVQAALAEVPDLHLTLVGEGELRGALEAEIARLNLGNHVHLAGLQDEAGVRAALAAAQAMVLPSFAEGLPVVLMEAMAAGRPVLTTWVAGIPELVRDGVDGWLVPVGDPEALAAAMIALARLAPEARAAMGAAARERVLARHDIALEARKLAAFFAQS